MALHNEVGKKGEELAKNYLAKHGYRIQAINWRFRKKELDIIAEKNNLLVVVEVKTRTNLYFENPKEAVTRRKQKFIIDAAEAYIVDNNIDMETRFDIVEVTIINQKIEIEHIEDAFQPSLM